ncbi:MAG: hypothetical protein RMK80_07510 [Pseudobdellovibrionaceae bacterium]|nr:hypothetical protein [Pseudobdellovibrionaceae bacterium]
MASNAISFLFKHKFKILSLIALVFIILIWRFPYQELRPLITQKIYELSGQRLSVIFQTMNISLIPLKLAISDVTINSPNFKKGLRFDKIMLIPGIDLFLKKLPSGKLIIENIFSGRLSLSLSPGRPTENGGRLFKAELLVDHLSLINLMKTLGNQIEMDGKITTRIAGEIDPSLNTQPDLDWSVEIEQWNVGESQFNTMMGPLTIPGLSLGTAQGTGRWSNGKLQIESLKLGGKDSPINGEIKGYVQLMIVSQMGHISWQTSGLQLDIYLTVLNQIPNQLAIFLSLIERYKTGVPGGNLYKVRVTQSSPYSPPSFGPIN